MVRPRVGAHASNACVASALTVVSCVLLNCLRWADTGAGGGANLDERGGSGGAGHDAGLAPGHPECVACVRRLRFGRHAPEGAPLCPDGKNAGMTPDSVKAAASRVRKHMDMDEAVKILGVKDVTNTPWEEVTQARTGELS